MNKQHYTLITGAGKGFGRAMAIECARRQLNLILVSLPGESLHQFAGDISLKYAVDAIAIETDLCEEDSCQALFNRVKAMQLSVNMLINNAGIGSTAFFTDGCLHQYEQQIRLNVLATMQITYLFLEMLQQNSPAYILNVGSLASFFSLQKKQVYGATKSFVFYFSKSLRRELRPKGIYVSVVCPGGMYTNSDAINTLATGNLISRTSGMYPEDVAPIALQGLLQKKEVIVPGKINWTLVFLNRIVPRFVVRFFEERTMKRLHTPKVAGEQPPLNKAPVYDISHMEGKRIRSLP